MKDNLAAISASKRLESSSLLAEVVERWEGWGEIRTVLSFASLASEIDTARLHGRVLSAGKTLALPRVSGEELSFHRVEDPAEVTGKNRFGIREPETDSPLVPLGSGSRILVMTPGLAFDRRGRRLGRGRGFYDRFLARLPAAVKMGLCFDFQLVEQVPAGDEDIAVDWIATDRRLLCTQVME